MEILLDEDLEKIIKKYEAHQHQKETIELYRAVEKLKPKIILEIV